MLRRRNLMFHKSKLPSGYILLDYIQSTGTEYIVLDLPITKDTVCHIKFIVHEQTGNCIMGSSQQFRFFNANQITYLDWSRLTGGGRIYGSAIRINTLYDIEFGDFYVKNLKTGTNIIEGTPWGGTVQYNSEPIKLMYAGSINPNTKAKGRFYIAQVYEKGELVRNLLPCINNDGKVGMFDTITRTFYGNSGTGKFIAGYKYI